MTNRGKSKASFEEALEELGSGGRRAVYVLAGGERYLAEKFVGAARKALVGEGGLDFSLFRWSREDAASVPDRVEGVCRSHPFFGDVRLVVLDDFAPRSPKEASWLVRYAENPCASTCLVVVSQEEDARCLKDLRAVRSSSLAFVDCRMSAEQLKALAKALFSERGISVAKEALEEVVGACGGNPWALENEAEKISLSFLGEKALGVAEISEALSAAHWVETRIFDFIDAVVSGSESSAALRNLLRSGALPAYLVHMLSGHLLLILRARLLLESGMKPGEAVAGLVRAGAHAFTATRCVRAAARISWTRAEKALKVLWETDLRVKGIAGPGWDASQALEHASLAIAAALEGKLLAGPT